MKSGSLNIWSLMEYSNQTNPTLRRYSQVYLIFSILVLSLAAIGKLTSNFSDPGVIKHDPFLTSLTNGQLMVIAAVVELLVVAILGFLLTRNLFKGILINVWLCSLFAIYRVGFQTSPEVAGACKCFGVGSLFGKLEAKFDGLSIVLLAVMLCGAIGLLLSSYLLTKNQKIKTAAILCGVIGLHTTSAHAQTNFTSLYSVEGVLKSESGRKGAVQRTKESHFRVALDGEGRWKMSIQNTIFYKKDEIHSTEEISYNGVDIFNVSYSDKKLDKYYKVVTNPPPEKAEHPARVARGPFPIDFGERVGTLWIAFLGGEYQKKNPTNQIPNLLVASARNTPITWVSDFRFRLVSESQNPLIESGMFVLNTNKIFYDLLYYPEVEEPVAAKLAARVSRVLENIKSPHHGSGFDFQYKLEESIMFGSNRIPIRFTSIAKETFDAEDFVSRSIVCQVTNIITNNSTSEMLPSLLGAITVQDRRFAKKTKTNFLNSIFYDLGTMGWIVSTNDKRFHDPNGIYNGMMINRQTLESISVRKHIYTTSIIVFFGLVSLPLYMVLRKCLKRQSVR